MSFSFDILFFEVNYRQFVVECSSRPIVIIYVIIWEKMEKEKWGGKRRKDDYIILL